MSLITKSSKKLIAETDLRCYKVFQKLENGRWKTFPVGYDISLDVLTKVTPLRPKEKSCLLSKIKSLKKGMPRELKGYYEITKGAIHVCTEVAILRENLKDAKLKKKELDDKQLEIWEVIIPEGSWYFEDISGESLAAEQIRLSRVI